MGYSFQEKSGTHSDLVPILHFFQPQFPFRNTDLVGAWLSLVEGEPARDGVRGWEAGPTGRSELPRRKHRGRSVLVALLLRFLNLSGACRERSGRHLLARDIGGLSGPPASRDPGGRRLGPRPVPPAGRRGGPTSDSSPSSPAGICRGARFRRWQLWSSPERPAMAGAPSLLRLALLLLGAVGRAGPRPQVSPRDPGDKREGDAAVFCERWG